MAFVTDRWVPMPGWLFIVVIFAACAMGFSYVLRRDLARKSERRTAVQEDRRD